MSQQGENADQEPADARAATDGGTEEMKELEEVDDGDIQANVSTLKINAKDAAEKLAKVNTAWLEASAELERLSRTLGKDSGEAAAQIRPASPASSRHQWLET